jgi:hypothetical protein
VRQEEDVVKEISLKVEVLMDMYQAMHSQQMEMASMHSYDRHYGVFKGR